MSKIRDNMPPNNKRVSTAENETAPEALPGPSPEHADFDSFSYDRAVHRLLELSREKLLHLPGRSRRKIVYLLYHERMLDLIESAMRVREHGAPASGAILIRSALECSVDMINLSRGEHYLLILRASVLLNRYEIYRYKTPALYDSLLAEQGGAQTAKAGKELLEEFKRCLKEATVHYPSLQNNPRNLSVISRFRLANRKNHYHTLYTWLSIQSHNDLEALLLADEFAQEDEFLKGAQAATQNAAILHLALELLVDGVECIHRLFGPDNGFIENVISTLEESRVRDSAAQGGNKKGD